MKTSRRKKGMKKLASEGESLSERRIAQIIRRKMTTHVKPSGKTYSRKGRRKKDLE